MKMPLAINRNVTFWNDIIKIINGDSPKIQKQKINKN